MFYRLSCKGSAWKTHNIQILTPSVHAFVRSRSLGTCSRMVPSTSPSQPPSSVNEGNGVSSPCPCAMFLPFYRSISNELGWPRTKGSESESKTFLLLNYVSFVSFKIIFVHFWSSCTLQSSWGVVTCIYDSLYLFFFFMPRSSLHPSAVPLAYYSFLLMLLILAHVMAHNVYINWGNEVPLQGTSLVYIVCFKTSSCHVVFPLDHFPIATDPSP